jgi:large subunit ribosomal protein L33
MEIVVNSVHVSGMRRRDNESMARNEIRPIVKLRSTAGTGYTYVTRKNRRNDPDRMILRKFDPVTRQHVDFREER